MDHKNYEILLEQEERKQSEFKEKFNSFRGSIEEKLFLVGANCFSDVSLEFSSLDSFQDILNEEEILSLIRFKNKILRNNQCLGYASDVISSLFRNPNSLDFRYFINLNGKNNMFEFCQIFYLIFQRLGKKQLIKKDSQTTELFGKLRDYRTALNHSPIRKGWIYPAGTMLEEMNLTQQEAIKELFAMLELAKQRKNK
ncbi:hypothetical protein BW152_00255 [Lactococcus lactis]|uniref:hypothetical protein n=1 Tax=Lactococcus lactis TaxID=1358 RepID=UPI000BF79845|nr:hypothetical protein [Lactococcus lactis]PFG85536.1 hypothetical protein BW152_00255 [Lactococcus lactis]